MYNLLWRVVGENAMPMTSDISVIGEEITPDPQLEKTPAAAPVCTQFFEQSLV